MHLAYDLTIRALYITLSDKDVARTREIDSNTWIDLAADDTVTGIEVLNIDRPWALATVLRDYELPSGEEEHLLACCLPPAPSVIL
jgi:uncharacterized protein YuzE